MAVFDAAFAWAWRNIFLLLVVAVSVICLVSMTPNSNASLANPQSWSRSLPSYDSSNNSSGALPVAFVTSSLGMWHREPNVTRVVQFTVSQNASQTVSTSIYDDEAAHTCPDGSLSQVDEAGNQCLSWTPRAMHQNTSASSMKEAAVLFAHATYRTPSGNSSSPTLSMRIPFLHSTQAGSWFSQLTFSAVAPEMIGDTDTSAARGSLKWIALASRQTSENRERRYVGLPVDDDDDDSSESTTDVTVNETELLTPTQRTRLAELIRRFHGSRSEALRANETLELFGLMHARATMIATAAAQNKTNSTAATVVTPSVLFSDRCLWLGEFTFNTGPALPLELQRRAATQVTGKLWSTCGDAIRFTMDDAVFGTYTRQLNLLLVCGIAVAVVPFFVGIVQQQWWVHNSRGRCLRVSVVQIMLGIAWCASMSANLTYFSAMSPQVTKAKTALSAVLIMASMMLIGLSAAVRDGQLVASQGEGPDGENRRSSAQLVAFVVYTFSHALLGQFKLLFSGTFLLVLAVTCWLPQWYVCVRQNGWTGLVVPYIVGFGGIMSLPLIGLAWFVPEPFVLQPGLRWKLLLAAFSIIVQSLVLVANRVANGHNFLAHWLAPWQHRYTTTVEAQRAALSENNDCPICRGPLDEKTEEGDELWVTPCHHLFHKMCLEQWLLERMECPLCRTVLPDP